MAFLGTDKLDEWKLDGRLERVDIVDSVPIDCRMVLAGPASSSRGIPTRLGMGDLLTVATSYPKLLGAFATKKGLNLVVTETPTGSCEAYAIRGRTDLVFDIKQSGKTLAENNLVVYREDEQLKLNVLSDAVIGEPNLDDMTVALRKIARTYIERLRTASSEPYISSYTIELMRDPNKQIKKFGEEFAELLQALLIKPVNKSNIINESADLLYALQVMLARYGLNIIDVLDEDIRRNQTD